MHTLTPDDLTAQLWCHETLEDEDDDVLQLSSLVDETDCIERLLGFEAKTNLHEAVSER